MFGPLAFIQSPGGRKCAPSIVRWCKLFKVADDRLVDVLDLDAIRREVIRRGVLRDRGVVLSFR